MCLGRPQLLQARPAGGPLRSSGQAVPNMDLVNGLSTVEYMTRFPHLVGQALRGS